MFEAFAAADKIIITTLRRQPVIQIAFPKSSVAGARLLIQVNPVHGHPGTERRLEPSAPRGSVEDRLERLSAQELGDRLL